MRDLGAGPKTALRWCGGVGPRSPPCSGHSDRALHLFPRHIMGIGLAVGLVEVLVGTWAGAWLYREGTCSPQELVSIPNHALPELGRPPRQVDGQRATRGSRSAKSVVILTCGRVTRYSEIGRRRVEIVSVIWRITPFNSGVNAASSVLSHHHDDEEDLRSSASLIARTRCWLLILGGIWEDHLGERACFRGSWSPHQFRPEHLPRRRE